MGFYIEVPENKGKAAQLAKLYGADIMDAPPETFDDVPENLALICVVDNGLFEAAALCYCADEFAAFNDPADYRRRRWVLMDKAKAHELTGFTS